MINLILTLKDLPTKRLFKSPRSLGSGISTSLFGRSSFNTNINLSFKFHCNKFILKPFYRVMFTVSSYEMNTCNQQQGIFPPKVYIHVSYKITTVKIGRNCKQRLSLNIRNYWILYCSGFVINSSKWVE